VLTIILTIISIKIHFLSVISVVILKTVDKQVVYCNTVTVYYKVSSGNMSKRLKTLLQHLIILVNVNLNIYYYSF